MHRATPRRRAVSQAPGAPTHDDAKTATGDSTLAGSRSRQTLSTDRLEAFSDGVFAVAITLLIFGIATGPFKTGELTGALLKLWPSYAAYIISFLTIGIIWVNHHATFSRIRAVDRPLLFINLLLLMTIAFIPFPTNLLGANITVSGGAADARSAAVLYGATMTAMSVCFQALWAYAVYSDLIDPKQLDSRQARASVWRFGAGIVVYAATIGIGFVSATLDLAIFGALAIFYVFDHQQTG